MIKGQRVLVTVRSSLWEPTVATIAELALEPIPGEPEPTTAADVAGDAVALVVASDCEHRDLESFVADLRARWPALSVVAVVTPDARSVNASGNVEATLLDAGASAVVRADGSAADWTAVLRRRLGAVVDGGRTGPTSDRTRTHEVTSTLEELDREFSICETTVAEVGDIIDYDACIIAEADEEHFVPLAATASEPRPGRARLRVDEGVAGETYRSGHPTVVDDVATHHTARTDLPYSSVLSVPVGDFGVLQLASTDVAAYDDGDRELAELIAGSLAHALTRVRYERQLTQERDRATALFQNIPDAAVEYVLVDGEPRIERVNSAFVNVFGYDPPDVVGESTLDLLVPPGDVDEAMETHEALRAGELTEHQVSRVTDDGVEPFLLRDVPIAGDDATPRGYLIYTDISELVERERELEQQNERLDTFASMVSHDLRNPLSAAQGYTDLALETEDLSHLSVVQTEHERMFDMIDDLLALARQGDSIGTVEPVALRQVVEAAWSTVDTRSATIETGSLPTVQCDADRIQQLFENLVRNAVSHGGDDVTVTVDGFDGGFYVADDGPGIPEDEREAVLEIGMTTEASTGGTGLGLAIVAEVANGHGWSVAVTESESGGARFEFDLDAARDEEVNTA